MWYGNNELVISDKTKKKEYLGPAYIATEHRNKPKFYIRCTIGVDCSIRRHHGYQFVYFWGCHGTPDVWPTKTSKF